MTAPNFNLLLRNLKRAKQLWKAGHCETARSMLRLIAGMAKTQAGVSDAKEKQATTSSSITDQLQPR